jgi:DNA gyrase subunit A
VNNQSQPKILSLKEILEEYIAFQIEVITRRTEFDLKKARERAHILEGLRIAVDNIDEVIAIIRSSYNDARERLMERFRCRRSRLRPFWKCSCAGFRALNVRNREGI